VPPAATRDGSSATNSPVQSRQPGQGWLRCSTTPAQATPSSSVRSIGSAVASRRSPAPIAELGERRIMLRALREGIDTATPTARRCGNNGYPGRLRAGPRTPRRLAAIPPRWAAAGHQATEARPGATRPVTASRRNWRIGPRTRQNIRDRTSNGVPLPVSALAWSERVAVKLQHHLQRRQRRYEAARQPVTVRRAGERRRTLISPTAAARPARRARCRGGR
jgi:hypothetical protein